MKILFTIVSFLFFVLFANGQIIDPKRAAKRAAENRANQKIDQGIDKGLDKIEEGVGGIFSKKKKEENNNKSKKAEKPSSTSEGEEQAAADNRPSSQDAFSAYGKFDFVPGEKVIAIEDFSQDALGDFPAKWNTNGSGDLVKLNDNVSKFLKTEKETVFYPEFVKNLPENFTVEFDIAVTPEYSFYNGALAIGFTSEANVGANWRVFKKFGARKEPANNLEVGFHPTGAGGQRGMTWLHSYGGRNEIIKNDDEQSVLKTKGGNTTAHISIWRQKTRIRVYMNEVKVWDIPRAFPEGAKINALYFRNDGSEKENQSFFIGNLRVAVGAPDTRNKLITEGKYVTSGILFDVNSDKIKSESYGVLKDIANVLSENDQVKVKIIGHTDSDGDEASNLALSKKRAASVKKALSSQFGISDSRMDTDGKGESQPAGPNTTAEGKANNRRVEFIKQ